MSDVVERLAKRWQDAFGGQEWPEDQEDTFARADARWWMNAIAEELIATGYPCHGVAANWLRTQATQEGEDV